MNPERAHDTLKQLLQLRERKLQRARSELAAEQVELSCQQQRLVDRENQHEQAKQEAIEQEAAWFQEAKESALSGAELERLLAKISILRDGVSEKGQAVAHQQQQVEKQQQQVERAQEALQLKMRELVKLEKIQDEVKISLDNLKQKQEDQLADEAFTPTTRGPE